MGENNNVLIKEIIASQNQPEWGQALLTTPEPDSRDSRVFVLGSSAHPATLEA